ncbi:MAG: hypothetical protein J1E33_03765 [Alistipes sp.]|nr:hypothetical protein [Alistipes sp.]
MKSKLLAQLQTKFAGVESAILERIATKKVEGVTDESELPTIAEGITFQDVLKSYGDYRAGAAGVSAVRNYEKQHNLKDGHPIEPTGEGGGKGNPNPDDFKTMLEQMLETKLKPLQDELNGYKSKEEQAARMASVRNLAKSSNLDDDILNEILALKDAISSETLDETVVKEKMSALQTRLVASSLPPKHGGIFSDGKATIEETDKIAKDIFK